MYATFPTGISGLPPGHLFASTPYISPAYSSGGPGNSSSLGGQRLNFSSSQLPHQGEASSEVNLQHQQIMLTIQTVYQQQLVLQSQLNQMCLAMQQMQATLGQLAADPNRAHHTSAGYGAPASEGPRSGEAAPSATSDRVPPQASSALHHHHHGNTSTTHSDTRRYSSGLSEYPLQQGAWDADADARAGEDYNQSSTPVSQVVPDAQQQGSRVHLDPPRRSPSKRGSSTPSRAHRVESPPPPALATSPSRHSTQSVHVATPAASPPSPTPPSQPVVLTWDPKKYSRSSSVGSANSHASQPQHHTASHPLVPTPLHGVAPRQSGSGVASAADQSADSIASSQHATQHVAPIGSSFSDDRLNHPIAQPRQHAPPKILERVIGKQNAPLYQPSTLGRPPSGPPGGSGPTSTSYHDVSLSDDGYMSMDSAQYMQRFHLK